MVDHITEIFLPGRTVATSAGDPPGRATTATLPSFVAGPENCLVATAINRLLPNGMPARDAATTRPTLLVLYGPSGSGKTHLARGLVRAWQDWHDPQCAEYITASDLRREFAAALDADRVTEFRQRVRGRRLLAIDDLHQLPGEPYLLQELRYTLEDYEQDGGFVVITSARPASMLANLPPDLRSRFAAGLTLQLSPAGNGARQHIVHQATAVLGRPVNGEFAARLAAGVPGSVNELFGAVLELCANSPTPNEEAQFANRLLTARAARQPTLREIIAIVAKYYKQPQAVLKSASRRQSAVLPRAVIVYLARELGDHSYDSIGRALGGRDHSTIMHNYRKIQSSRQRDLGLQSALDELHRILMSG